MSSGNSNSRHRVTVRSDLYQELANYAGKNGMQPSTVVANLIRREISGDTFDSVLLRELERRKQQLDAINHSARILLEMQSLFIRVFHERTAHITPAKDDPRRSEEATARFHRFWDRLARSVIDSGLHDMLNARAQELMNQGVVPDEDAKDAL